MTIRDIAAYAKLTRADIDAIGAELDAIRSDIEESLGARDAAYIRRVIVFQRALDVAARLLIAGTRSKAGLLVGTALLAYAKSVENMEIGHNVCHGQWDWMNDPEIHSTTWEWDMVGPSAQWRYSHNYHHHVFSNVLGVDDDLGFGILRMSRDQQWEPQHLVQPLRNVLLALIFEWGIALHDFYSARDRAATEDGKKAARQELHAKVGRQLTKDYVILPALSLRRWKRTLVANLGANLLRNLWAYLVIFCGHFPDGAERFGPETLQDESRGEWYLRQMLGAANFKAGPVLAFSSGNLCYQIEHHLFPDLPSNRLAEVSLRVRALCEKYDLPYTSGPLTRQYLQTLRTIFTLAVPDAGWRSVFGAAPPV
ncbi:MULTISPECIES: fatty acid desaturase [unclassified Mycolicibacterium]|uniref:fatty acid desaturase family protein n=1 Tax=unclassified Mycolicibacterium TaxID=2636767 RepID=UPI0012DBF39B|nr:MULTISPECIES: fatty acid desaturase [unclassified Mycolicibacterium]MUL81577.1 fatty acid desaturase [Mycolicibacterium sp. CBMA 329]MUL87343.1 fatty acid desaturase [Mycolicibacterium sp. CBMA 331]MUM02630.1 fatty acid desaturase [Mycolicibacterium sp. CBMA 334]MUM28473.1 fatty acid desaturase [Mycolicibacterium sp. CBMA 295]MUM37640.1 fatty acid desaturase [Mycolicibacterium sp. CBMA 247]